MITNNATDNWFMPIIDTYMVVQKTRLFLSDDNFAMVNGRKVSYMTGVSEFCLAKVYNLHVSAFKYSLLKLCSIWQKYMDFTQFLTGTYSENNNNNHLYTELLQMKFSMPL